MAALTVEFLGIPRERAGCDRLDIEADNVETLLQVLAEQLPGFAACLDDNQLRAEYLVCINGQTFTRDGALLLNADDEILILSADVGG